MFAKLTSMKLLYALALLAVLRRFAEVPCCLLL